MHAFETGRHARPRAPSRIGSEAVEGLSSIFLLVFRQRNLNRFQAIVTLLVIISLTSVKVQGIFLDSSVVNTV